VSILITEAFAYLSYFKQTIGQECRRLATDLHRITWKEVEAED